MAKSTDKLMKSILKVAKYDRHLAIEISDNFDLFLNDLRNILVPKVEKRSKKHE